MFCKDLVKRQEHVFYETYDWTNKLCDSIHEIKNGDELFECIFVYKHQNASAFGVRRIFSYLRSRTVVINCVISRHTSFGLY